MGYLKFSNYTVSGAGNAADDANNLLNNVWFQPEEIFPVDGVPEERQHTFWVEVDERYFNLSTKLLVMPPSGKQILLSFSSGKEHSLQDNDGRETGPD